MKHNPETSYQIYDREEQKYLSANSWDEAIKYADEVGEIVILEHTKKDVITHHKVGNIWLDAKAYETSISNKNTDTGKMSSDEHVKYFLESALYIQNKEHIHHFVYPVEGIRPVFVNGEFDSENKYLEKFRDYIATCIKVIHDPDLRANERFELLDNHEFLKLALPRPEILETFTKFDAIQSFSEKNINIDRAQKFAYEIAYRFDADFEKIYAKHLIPVDSSILNYKSEFGTTALIVGGKPVLQTPADIEAESAIVENAHKYIHRLATHYYNEDLDKLERTQEVLKDYIQEYTNERNTKKNDEKELYYIEPALLQQIIETQAKNVSDFYMNQQLNNVFKNDCIKNTNRPR